jgi:hypothetical protein
MKTYNLNQLYHEAKALLEKYNYVKDTHKLSVSFTIEEKDSVPKLRVSIWYDNDLDRNWDSRIGAYSVTPAYALNEFEEELQKKTGKHLIERVGVEIE